MFGTRLPAQHYIVRPSAYAVLRNAEEKIAAVRAPQGVFLPGGGSEPGETSTATAMRESQEECGLLISIKCEIGSAIELVHSPEDHEYFEKRCIFFEAAVVGSCCASEQDHALLWLPLDDALRRLKHGSHVWAIHQLCGET